LNAGTNELLFACGRGALRARLVEPRAELMLNTDDMTLPDLVVGEGGEALGAVVLLNASVTPHLTRDKATLSIVAEVEGAEPTETIVRGHVPALGTRKVEFKLKGPTKTAGTLEVKLRLMRWAEKPDEVLDEAEFTLRVRGRGESRKRTFKSGVDGSVQYYAVRPARPIPRPREPTNRKKPPRPGLVLTLHGAGVEASGQVDAYGSKSWTHIVAPTNRRPFGFDWEDWGRVDAMEVLGRSQLRLKPDPSRIYLTGHSMGGHGTWHLGATFPDRFAAIAPSAGWISFFTYGGKRREAKVGVGAMLARASSASDTATLLGNYAKHGIYILHGDADKNVPVGQARAMRKLLLERGHPGLGYHEQRGAKHWWDDSPEPGASCVDWPQIFDTFARHVRPQVESVRRFTFTTASPGVSSRCHWLTVFSQERMLLPSTVEAECDPHRRRFRLKTKNVSRLVIEPASLKPGAPFTIEIDGQTLEDVEWQEGFSWPTESLPEPGAWQLPGAWLAKSQGTWTLSHPTFDLKSPLAYGPFKQAFRHSVALVYATRGTPEENAWAYRKARYDAETFWYRGNGDLKLMPDVDLKINANHKNVVLYGHAQSNAAWDALLGDGPVRVERGRVTVGERVFEGDDLACLFVRPRPVLVKSQTWNNQTLVGVISGSGAIGQRLTERLPIFVSGAGFPDLFLMRPDILSTTSQGELSGFFGEDWSVERGEWGSR
jgi:dienelactone hydrolase